MLCMSYKFNICFEHEIFFQWYSGYNNAKTRVFFSCGVINCKKRRKKKGKKGMALMKNLFLTLILIFNAIALLLF